jgi:hypothetical protein
MNRRVQPGDIAISVNTDLPENAGLLVEVLAVNVVDPFWGNRHGRLCRVRSAGKRPIHVSFLIAGKWRRQIVREAVAPENSLRPITPPEGELDQDKKLELLTQ